MKRAESIKPSTQFGIRCEYLVQLREFQCLGNPQRVYQHGSLGPFFGDTPAKGKVSSAEARIDRFHRRLLVSFTQLLRWDGQLEPTVIRDHATTRAEPLLCNKNVRLPR